MTSLFFVPGGGRLLDSKFEVILLCLNRGGQAALHWLRRGSIGFMLEHELMWLRMAEVNDNEEKFDNREFG